MLNFTKSQRGGKALDKTHLICYAKNIGKHFNFGLCVARLAEKNPERKEFAMKKVDLVVAGLVVPVSVSLDRRERRDYTLLSLEKGPSEESLVTALGDHCLAQHEVIGGATTTIVTDFGSEGELALHLQGR